MRVSGIQSIQKFCNKISDMNSSYYELHVKLVQAERQIVTPGDMDAV